MGIIIKNYSFNGLEVPTVYAGIDKGTSSGNLSNFTVGVKVYASIDARVKGLAPIHFFVINIDLASEENSSTPIYKAIYNKLKEMFAEVKDYRDFDKTKNPKVIGVEYKKTKAIITGTTDGELKISGLHSMEECEVVQKGKDWKITMEKDVFLNRYLYVSAEDKDQMPSDSVQVEKPAEEAESE